MTEKLETQFVVIKKVLGRLVPNLGLRWFDSREQAREYAGKKNRKRNGFSYHVYPMKRGPRA